MTPAAAQSASGLYGAEFLGAIDWALNPHEDERPQSIADFLARLGIATADLSHRRPPPSATPAVAPAVKTSASAIAAAGSFDPDLLKRIETEAAQTLGPIAPVLVRNALRTATTPTELCAIVAQDIDDEKARAAFLKKFAHEERTAAPAVQPLPDTTVRAQSSASKFSTDLLQRTESDLARHIGAVAGVVIQRAAANARDEAELYLLIADEIKDPAEKKAFVRKAVMASRQR